MKNLKKILALALCLMMAMVLLTSCGNKLEGKWTLIDSSIDGYIEEMKEADGSMVWEFKDGEVTVTMKAGSRTMTDTTEYEVDDDKLIIDGDEAEFEVKGNKLTVIIDGEEMIFKRK